MIWRISAQITLVAALVTSACSSEESRVTTDAGNHVPFDASTMDATTRPADAHITDAATGETDAHVEADGSDSGDQCGAAIQEAHASPIPSMGFGNWVSECFGAQGATVSTVTADKLELLRASDDALLTFHWSGPDLSTRFQIGEPVQIVLPGLGCTPSEGWHLVEGVNFVAATWFANASMGATPPPPLPTVPDAGPSLSRELLCTFTYEAPCEPLDSPWSFEPIRKVYGLVQAAGSESVLLGPGETGEIAGWTVTNVRDEYDSGWQCVDGTADDYHVTIVTALAPVTPG